MDELEDEVPPTTRFSLGYFDAGKQSSKKWLVTQEDLDVMYRSSSTDFFLWCDGCCDDSKKRQREVSPTPSKRAAKEMEVDGICTELKDLHKGKYTEPQYRLWARMIVNGVHSSKNDPPQVPMIVGYTGTRAPKKSFEETIANTVAAVAKIVSPQQTTPSQPSAGMGISPGKAVEIRGKCYAQLASLKKLFEESVIDERELEEQKGCILGTLRKLS